MLDNPRKAIIYLLDAKDSVGISFVHALSQSTIYTIFAFVFGDQGSLRFSSLCSVIRTEEDEIPQNPERLRQLAASEERSVLMPLTTRAIEWLIHHREQLSRDWILPPVSSAESVRIAENKDLFHKFLASLQIPTPNTFELSDFSSETLKYISYPVLCKPTVGYGGFGIKVLHNRQELTTLLADHKNQKGSIIQEFVVGQDRGIGVFCQNGKVLKSAIFEKLTHKRKFGPPCSYNFVSDKNTFAMIEKISKEMNLNGLANFDLLYLPHRDITLVLELNLRAWASLRGPVAYGVNFADAACEAALGQEVSHQHLTEGYVVQNSDLLSITPRLYLRGIKLSLILPGLSLRYVFQDLRTSVHYLLKSVLHSVRGRKSFLI